MGLSAELPSGAADIGMPPLGPAMFISSSTVRSMSTGRPVGPAAAASADIIRSGGNDGACTAECGPSALGEGKPLGIIISSGLMRSADAERSSFGGSAGRESEVREMVDCRRTGVTPSPTLVRRLVPSGSLSGCVGCWLGEPGGGVPVAGGGVEGLGRAARAAAAASSSALMRASSRARSRWRCLCGPSR